MSRDLSGSRGALLNAAASVLARNPGASLAEIAKAAGVGRATLHRWFATREDLRRELALDALRACDDATAHIDDSMSARDALAEVIRAIVPLGDRFRFLSTDLAVLEDPAVEQVYERQMHEMAELIDAAKQEGVLDPAVPTAWIAAALDSLIYTAWESVDRGDVARNDAAALVERTFLRGIQKEDA